MSTDVPARDANPTPLSDEEVVARIRGGDVKLFEILMRRYNQRLFRVARAILDNDEEAEDVMQDAYVRAYTHLEQFAGRARFATWLTRIAVHEALARKRRRARFVDLAGQAPAAVASGRTPEETTSDRELGLLLTAAIDALPAAYRLVFMLREVEGLDTLETARCLDIPVPTVKTRLHRARALLRDRLRVQVDPKTAGAAYAFAGARCDRVVARVLTRIAALGGAA